MELTCKQLERVKHFESNEFESILSHLNINLFIYKHNEIN